MQILFETPAYKALCSPSGYTIALMRRHDGAVGILSGRHAVAVFQTVEIIERVGAGWPIEQAIAFDGFCNLPGIQALLSPDPGRAAISVLRT